VKHKIQPYFGATGTLPHTLFWYHRYHLDSSVIVTETKLKTEILSFVAISEKENFHNVAHNVAMQAVLLSMSKAQTQTHISFLHYFTTSYSHQVIKSKENSALEKNFFQD
jgi:hypothetical protein